MWSILLSKVSKRQSIVVDLNKYPFKQTIQVLGLGRITSQADLFKAAAAALNIKWKRTKTHGYELCRWIADNGLSREPLPAATSPDFLTSYIWRKLRLQVLIRDGRRCVCCGATPEDGVRLNVDHIKPRKLFPGLALDADNLQVLCEDCNHGKGNWNQTDWRPEKLLHMSLCA